MGPNAAVSTSQKKRGPVVMRVPGEDVEEEAVAVSRAQAAAN